jgi:hypothetical protein
MSGQERRRRDIAAGAGSDTLGNDGLIRGDVVRGNVLHRDLLLPSASMVIEPFRRRTYPVGPRSDPGPYL